jgi:transposase
MKVMYVGCDVAKGEIVVSVSVKGMIEKLPAVSNDLEGFKALTREVKKLKQKHKGYKVQIVLEPTGGYEMGLAVFAHQQDWQVCLVNPKHVRDWANSQGQRAKTDALDAQMLAEYAAQRPKNNPLPLWQPLPGSLIQLDSLLNRRRDLEQMLLQETNRQAMYANRPGMDQAVLANLRTHITALNESLDAINQAIDALIDKDPSMREQINQLDSVPGVGAKVVLPLYVLLARWHFMTNGSGCAKALTAFVGLDPTTHQSGQSTRRGGISKTGDPEMRRLLFMAALGGKRGKNPLHDFFEHLLGENKIKMVALVACARKVLTWSWAVFHSHSFFDPKFHAKSA